MEAGVDRDCQEGALLWLIETVRSHFTEQDNTFLQLVEIIVLGHFPLGMPF